MKKRKASHESQGSQKRRSRGNSLTNKVVEDQPMESEDKKAKKKMDAQFILSKRQATRLNTRSVRPVIHEPSQRAYVACGPSILVYSLQTGLQVTTLKQNKEGKGAK